MPPGAFFIFHEENKIKKRKKSLDVGLAIIIDFVVQKRNDTTMEGQSNRQQKLNIIGGLVYNRINISKNVRISTVCELAGCMDGSSANTYRA